MLRKAELWVVAALTATMAVAAIAVTALAPPAGAEGFNPATQSHEGACARETTVVRAAVRDYEGNGVLSYFANLISVHPERERRAHVAQSALLKAMGRRLVVGSVERKVVTENHGCDGEGHWFPVGLRTLSRGEEVGVKVSRKLRLRLCLKRNRGCRQIVVKAAVVFPINCWNPNMGRVNVVLYVERRRKA